MGDDAKARSERINNEMLDSFDEELELEIDDDRLARLLNEASEHPEPGTLDRRIYFKELFRMQGELVKLQDWVQYKQLKVVVLFEGRDSAGKGGVIKRITQRLNPRVCRVAALPAPNERERTQWYFQRYIANLPSAGEIVLFDRSWYNRAGVEKVMGFCTPDQTQDFLNAAPEFERHLIDAGMLLLKYWLCCDQAVQEQRFENRLHNPVKRWKLSPIDIEARERYDDYTEARELMLAATHTDFAPWTLVDFNDQPVGRLTLLRDLLDRVPDTELPLAEIAWPSLGHELLKEHYGVLQPIPNYQVHEQEDHHHRHDGRHNQVN
jgi:polyphosphate kinase